MPIRSAHFLKLFIITRLMTTPIVVVSGFLGAGKTSLVQHLLNTGDRKIGLLVNDVGRINIDASLIKRETVDHEGFKMVQVENGCACCSASDDLYVSIRKLMTMGSFDVIVIECSGVAEPKRLFSNLDAAFEEEGISDKVAMSHVVTVVDCQQFMNNLTTNKEGDSQRFVSDLLAEQLEAADLILVNKTDRVTIDEVARVSDVIQSMNPTSRILQSAHSRVPVRDVLVFDDPSTSAALLSTDEEHRIATKKRKLSSVQTYVYQRRRPFNAVLFEKYVIKEAPLWFRSCILRSKGFCWFADRMDMAFYFSQTGMHTSLSHSGAWWGDVPRSCWPLDDVKEIEVDFEGFFDDRRQELVFIGLGFVEKDVDQLFDKCLLSLEETLVLEK